MHGFLDRSQRTAPIACSGQVLERAVIHVQ